MTAIRRPLLDRLVALHEADDEPVTSERLARSLDADRAVVRDHLQSLCECELVTRESPDGYAPTITAHELLALDLDDDALVVVDIPDE